MQSPLTRRPHPDTTGATHVGGWRLGALWLIWAATALGVAYAAIVSIPEFIRQLSYGGLLADRIHASGIAPSLFLRLELTADIILLTAWAAVATFIVFQRPDDWMALVVSILILTSGYFLGSLQFIVQWSHVQPHLSFLFRILGALDILIFGSGLVVYGAFPSGHFMPRRLIPVMVAIFGYIAVGDLINVLDPTIDTTGYVDRAIRYVVFPIVMVYSLLYRRTKTSPLEGQQTKLVVAALLLGMIANVTNQLILLDFGQTVYLVVRPLALALCIVAALCFMYAILRYHVWDIDFALNRTLVYGLLALLLGVVLVGGYFALQGVLVSLLGGQAQIVAVIIPAIATTALFTPTLNRVRRFVDKDLYGIDLDYRKVAEEQALKQQRRKSVGVILDSFGPFRDLELVGRGGMSEVYRARHPVLHRTVAVKVLSQSLLEDQVARRRFEHEAQAISKLSHPNIVKLYEYKECDTVPYIVLEFLEGQSLSHILPKEGRLPLQKARPILRDIAAALDFAHKQGIVHRDVKPSNVIVDQGTGDIAPRAVLTDFGIAKLYNLTQLTSTGTMLGTLDYVSPEQIRGASEVDARADVYSLGVMAYELLTGQLPFEHKNAGALVMAHLMQPAPDPRNIVPDLPQPAAAALMRAMAKDPQERQASTGELVAEMWAREPDGDIGHLPGVHEMLGGIA